MTRDRKMRTIIVIALILSVLTISAAFAILSQNLDIATSGKVKSSIWSILFENLDYTTLGEATDNSSAVINGTKINIAAVFKNPGDKITYTFDVSNKGTLNAVLYAIAIDGDFDIHPDIKMKFSYNGDSDYGNDVPEVDNTLDAGESRPLKLEIKFDENATYITQEDRISNFLIQLIYVQENFPSDQVLEPDPYVAPHQLVTELYQIQHYVAAVAASNSAENAYIGTVVNQLDPVTIRGLTYWQGWYLVTKEDLEAVGLDTEYAPYIVRYSDGAVQSIPGAMIEGSPVHTLNYTGAGEDTLYLTGILTAVDGNSVATPSQWGEAVVGTGTIQNPPTVAPGGGSYSIDKGLTLGDKVAFLAIDQSRPVDQRYTINMTVKGNIYQDIETYGVTILAISDANSKYLAWVRIRNGYLQVITFSINNRANLTGNTSGLGYVSKEIPAKYNNNYMNIQVTAERSGTSKVYLNGELFSEFQSGTDILSYGNMTIGDLRPARGLKYAGTIYNFALYSEVLEQSGITQNWDYTKTQLEID